jgi:hypothetical protein
LRLAGAGISGATASIDPLSDVCRSITPPEPSPRAPRPH